MKESDQWKNYRKSLKVHIEKGDFSKPWEWSTVIATMYIGQSRMTTKALQTIRGSGVQAGCSWDDEDCTNLINQRYHLLQWEMANPDMKIEELKTILEVGAGYGAMTILVDRLGFRGKYYIVDLPELEQVQRKHLNLRGVKCRRKWGEIRKPDLLIGLASIGEIPIVNREGFMERIKPKSYLLSYAPSWGEDNNREWFEKWALYLRARGGPRYEVSPSLHENIEYLISTTRVS